MNPIKNRSKVKLEPSLSSRSSSRQTPVCSCSRLRTRWRSWTSRWSAACPSWSRSYTCILKFGISYLYGFPLSFLKSALQIAVNSLMFIELSLKENRLKMHLVLSKLLVIVMLFKTYSSLSNAAKQASMFLVFSEPVNCPTISGREQRLKTSPFGCDTLQISRPCFRRTLSGGGCLCSSKEPPSSLFEGSRPTDSRHWLVALDHWRYAAPLSFLNKQ